MAHGASCKRTWSMRNLRHMVTRWQFGKIFRLSRMVPIEVPLFLNSLKVPDVDDEGEAGPPRKGRP